MKFNYCSVIEVGDTFTRIDKNKKVWIARVISRTEYFVDVEKIQPYQIKVSNSDESSKYGCCHYEDAKPTIERCMLHRHYEEVECGESEKEGLFGKYTSKDYKKVPTALYYIDCKETWSAHSKYDRTYKLIKYGDGIEENPETISDSINKWFNYCENEKFE